MPILLDRVDFTRHSSILRPAGKAVTTRHAPQGDAPVRATWWERWRLFELHDLHTLHRAVRKGDVQAVKQELAHPRCQPAFVPKGREPVLFEALGASWLAGEHGRVFRQFKPGPPEVLQALLDDHRVDVNAVSRTQETVVQRAIEFDHGPAVAQLIQAGATFSQADLAAAVRMDRTASARVLFASGRIDCHESLPEDGRNALTLACEKGSIELLQAFLAEGTGTRVNEPDGRGTTGLTAALRSRQAAAVTLLLKSGASVDQRDAGNHTALWHAVDIGWWGALDGLMKHSTERQATGLQAMLHAIDRNDVRCVNALVGLRGIDWHIGGDAEALYRRAMDAGHADVAQRLKPLRIWAAQCTAAEAVQDLRDETDAPRRKRMLVELADAGDLNKIHALSRCADLQADIAALVETLVAQSRWPEAAALVSGLDTATWAPAPEMMRRIFSGDAAGWETQRAHRRTVADVAGTALIEALQRDGKRAQRGEPAPDTPCAQAWQQAHRQAPTDPAPAAWKTLPSRMAAIVIAAMTEGALPDEEGVRQPALDSLFKLDALPAREQAQVAREALRMMARCGGVGINPHFASNRGDYRFVRSETDYDSNVLHATLIDRLIVMSRQAHTD